VNPGGIDLCAREFAPMERVGTRKKHAPRARPYLLENTWAWPRGGRAGAWKRCTSRGSLRAPVGVAGERYLRRNPLIPIANPGSGGAPGAPWHTVCRD
jgi:hypothetical protein